MRAAARSSAFFVFLGGAAALAGAWLLYAYVYEPVRMTVSYMLARPYLKGCTTTIKTEGMVAAGKFRIVEILCPPSQELTYVVFLKRSEDFGAMGLLHSVESPVPQVVRQHDSQRYEIVLAAPLPDGRDRLPVTLDGEGWPEHYYGFRHGLPEK